MTIDNSCIGLEQKNEFFQTQSNSEPPVFKDRHSHCVRAHTHTQTQGQTHNESYEYLSNTMVGVSPRVIVDFYFFFLIEKKNNNKIGNAINKIIIQRIL